MQSDKAKPILRNRRNRKAQKGSITVTEVKAATPVPVLSSIPRRGRPRTPTRWGRLGLEGAGPSYLGITSERRENPSRRFLCLIPYSDANDYWTATAVAKTIILGLQKAGLGEV